MRITNAQKSELNEIIHEFNLKEDQFDFGGEDHLYMIKFKKNYFSFHINKHDTDKYENTISYVNQKHPNILGQTWKETTSQFRHWIIGIAEDEKYSPKLLSKVNNEFPIEITKYSKSFIEIYNQASIAETNGLGEICGLGYRKAFEFLIKDYLLKKHPKTEHERIKTMLLSPCINQYVTSDEIKLLAHRASWLGNDHAHYLKKWKGKTLADLKHLIYLTIKWIVIKDELSKVEKSMPSGR